MTTAIVDEEVAVNSGNEGPASKKICLDGNRDDELPVNIHGSANNSSRDGEHESNCAQSNESNETQVTKLNCVYKLKYSTHVAVSR